MKYLKKFNERLGISEDIEKLADKIFKTINSSNEKEFTFTYQEYNYKKNSKSNYSFKVKITTDRSDESKGSFSVENGEMSIKLVNRKDDSTLLHELKHLDFYIKKQNCFDDIYHKSNAILKQYANDVTDSSQRRIKSASTIFYVYNENEFESKYHGYYKNFDKFLSTKGPLESSDIVTYFKEFLESNDDNTYNWYFYKPKFNFSTFLSDGDINQMFYYYLNDSNKVSFSENMFIMMFQLLKYDIKKFYKIKFNKYTNEEMNKINKLRNFFEKDIDRKKEKYSRKLFRLITLMIEKYVDKY